MSVQQPESGDSDSRQMGRLFALAQVGFEMVVPIALGLFLDDRLGWTPWGVTAGAVLGLVGGMAHLLMMLKKFEQAEASSKRDKS
jgi:F0F1-type ATP synthase assembly protein I